MFKNNLKIMTVFTLLITGSLASVTNFASADEMNKTNDFNGITENVSSTLIYSGDEENTPLFKSFVMDYKGSKDSPQKVVINDGGYNWKYLTTYNGSNVFSNTTTSWLLTAAGGGIAGWAGKAIGNAILSNIAGALVGKASSDLNVGTNYYWTVKKYVDKDAYNVYVKYDIKIYSNSSRTKLVKSYVQVHKI